MASVRGLCANYPECKRVVKGYGKCDGCKAELRRLRSLFVFFAHLDSPDPTKDTPERRERIERFAERAARNLPLFPSRKKRNTMVRSKVT